MTAVSDKARAIAAQYGADPANVQRLLDKKAADVQLLRTIKPSAGEPTVSRETLSHAARIVTGTITIGNPPIAARTGDQLRLVLLFAPRSKKNHTQNYALQSKAYIRYRNAIVAHVESFKEQLGLPLPDQRYNCAARFFPDNDRADTIGLAQGLADALENAGVITNDRWLWTWDGTDQIPDDARPRVELTITPRAA